MFGVIRMVTGHGNKLLLGVRFFFQPRYHTTPGRIFQPLLQFFYRIIAILHKEEPTSYTFHTMPPTPARTRHTGPAPPASSTAASQRGTWQRPTSRAVLLQFIHHGTVPPPRAGRPVRQTSGRRSCGPFRRQNGSSSGRDDTVDQQDGSYALPASRNSASLIRGRSSAQRERRYEQSSNHRQPPHAQNRPMRYSFSAAETAVQSRPTRYFSAHLKFLAQRQGKAVLRPTRWRGRRKAGRRASSPEKQLNNSPQSSIVARKCSGYQDRQHSHATVRYIILIFVLT